ncbi:MAG: hypothetical protein ABIO72_00940 [Patescibacteria group bacterium]
MQFKTSAAFSAVLVFVSMMFANMAFAQPAPPTTPKPTCEADPKVANNAIDLMWADQYCRDKVTGGTGGTKPVPPTGQWSIVCGPNTVQNGILDCACDPLKVEEAKAADDELVKLDLIDSTRLVKVIACVPTAIKAKIDQEVIDTSKFATKEDLDKLRAEWEKWKTEHVVTPTLLGGDNWEEITHEIELLKKRKTSDMDLYVGLTAGVGTRNDVMGAFGLTGGVDGWIGKRFALGIQASVGLEIEPADSDQVSPWLYVQGSVLGHFSLDENRHFVLGVGPSFRQTIRPAASGNGIPGNFFGGSYGGRLELRIQPAQVPIGIIPFLELGGGPVAGWVDGKKFEGTMFQGVFGVDLVAIGGIIFNKEASK